MKILQYTVTALAAFSFQSCSNIPDDVKYTIYNKDLNKTFSSAKIYVELNKDVDKDVLKSIAGNISSDYNDYNRIYIFYHLPGMDKKQMAWATTHYTPDLELEILGVSSKEKSVMRDSAVVEGEVLGRWEDIRPYAEAIYMIYKNTSGELLLKKVLPSGESYDMEISTTDNKTFTYTEKDRSFEYMKIESNGNLGMYDYDENIKFIELASI